MICRDRELGAVGGVEDVLSEPELLRHGILREPRDGSAVHARVENGPRLVQIEHGDVARDALVDVRPRTVRRQHDAVGHRAGQGAYQADFQPCARVDDHHVLAVGVDHQQIAPVVRERERVRPRHHVGDRAVDAGDVLRVGGERLLRARDEHRKGGKRRRLEVEVGLGGVRAEQRVRHPHLARARARRDVVQAARLAVGQPFVAARRDVGDRVRGDPLHGCRGNFRGAGTEELGRVEPLFVPRPAEGPGFARYVDARRDLERARVDLDDAAVL